MKIFFSILVLIASVSVSAESTIYGFTLKPGTTFVAKDVGADGWEQVIVEAILQSGVYTCKLKLEKDFFNAFGLPNMNYSQALPYAGKTLVLKSPIQIEYKNIQENQDINTDRICEKFDTDKDCLKATFSHSKYLKLFGSSDSSRLRTSLICKTKGTPLKQQLHTQEEIQTLLNNL